MKLIYDNAYDMAMAVVDRFADGKGRSLSLHRSPAFRGVNGNACAWGCLMSDDDPDVWGWDVVWETVADHPSLTAPMSSMTRLHDSPVSWTGNAFTAWHDVLSPWQQVLTADEYQRLAEYIEVARFMSTEANASSSDESAGAVRLLVMS